VDIKSLHKQGLSIKAIARRLGISRNTVRKALRAGPPKYERPARPSKLDPYKDYLKKRLNDFPELCAVTLFEEIQSLGYTGGLSILKDFTRPHRVRRREPSVRFETAPGAQAQVDWSDLGTVTIAGKSVSLNLFAFVLGYSRAVYAEVTTCTDTQTLIDCHKRAFSYLGGAPAEILYDNMKTVVIKRGSHGDHRFNESFMDLAGTYGFVPKLCRPYRAKTKGKVERTIGYVKDRFLCGRTFSSLSQMNTELILWLETTANRRVHATTGEVPFERLEEERALLLPVSIPSAVGLQRAKRPLFIFNEAALPLVEERPLAVYEEYAGVGR
jgi:transposase